MLWNGLELPPAYYQDDAVYIIHGDCREVLPLIPDKSIDLVLTDPPYPNHSGVAAVKQFRDVEIQLLSRFSCRQLIFWSAVETFPLNYTSIHYWIKPNGFGGRGYESIYERNGSSKSNDYNIPSINSIVSARMSSETYYPHPTQKPARLIRLLINNEQIILDPFLGSGTTAYCAKKLGRKCIGIEIEEKYCEIAAKRCSQSVMRLEV